MACTIEFSPPTQIGQKIGQHHLQVGWLPVTRMTSAHKWPAQSDAPPIRVSVLDELMPFSGEDYYVFDHRRHLRVVSSVSEQPDTRGREMSLTIRDQSLALGFKWAGFLKQVFPAGERVKQIADFFGAAPATVKRWLQGFPPNTEVYHRAEKTWGPAFIAWMHQGYDWAEHLALIAEDDALEQYTESVRARLEAVEGRRRERGQENGKTIVAIGGPHRAQVRRA